MPRLQKVSKEGSTPPSEVLNDDVVVQHEGRVVDDEMSVVTLTLIPRHTLADDTASCMALQDTVRNIHRFACCNVQYMSSSRIKGVRPPRASTVINTWSP